MMIDSKEFGEGGSLHYLIELVAEDMAGAYIDGTLNPAKQAHDRVCLKKPLSYSYLDEAHQIVVGIVTGIIAHLEQGTRQ